MRRLIITLDDDLDPWMAKQTNQNETVRKALALYKGDITTDTIQGLRESYRLLMARLDERFDTYDESFRRMDKLISVLETRM